MRGAASGTSTLERASQVLQDLSKEIDRPSSGATVPSLGQRDRPIQVEVWQPDPGALQMLSGLITPLLHPLTTTGIVVIFVMFILLQRQDLRNRLVRLAGAQDLQRTTAAMDDAGQRLSRLFLTQLALNAGFGLVIGVGLWLIGVPSAPLWGMLAMIMRFVPYIGALVSAIFPLVLAAAVGPGWGMVMATAALFLSHRTDRRTRHRADGLWPEHGIVAGGDHRFGHVSGPGCGGRSGSSWQRRSPCAWWCSAVMSTS